jgi:small-conductance mechanosensitive channel
MDSLKITLDPGQLDKATKDLLKKQQKEIAKLKKKVDSLEYDLNCRKRNDLEVSEMRDKFERAKSAIADMLDIQVDDGQMGL